MDGTRERKPLLPLSLVAAFDLLEFLHQSDGGVTRFRQGELLADADSGTAVEGEVFLESKFLSSALNVSYMTKNWISSRLLVSGWAWGRDLPSRASMIPISRA